MKPIFYIWPILAILMLAPGVTLAEDALGNFLTQRARPAAAAGGADAGDLIMSAMGLLGVSYRFGGTNPNQGMDCSGFMQYIFRQSLKISLPRTASEMSSVGSAVARSELRPGDMVFFKTGGRAISHVGMYIGNDKFIHAPRTGKNIEITSLSSKYWAGHYAWARRVAGAERAAQLIGK